MPGISVIIPIYNVENYIEACLESVLKQNYLSYEIICVNDASIDSSMNIVEKYALMCNKIKIINHTQNRGLSAARNTGIDNAKGKYIFFLDADDMIKPEALEELFMYAEKNDLDDIFFNMDKIYGQEIQKMQNPEELIEYEGVYTGQEMFLCFMKDNAPRMEVWRQFYKRDFIKKNKLYFYEGILHEDILFSFLCAMKSKRVMNINKSYYIYRQRSGSITNTRDDRRIQSFYIIMLEIFKYWNSNIFSLNINRAIENYFERVHSMFMHYKNEIGQDSELKVGSYAERALFTIINRPIRKYATLNKATIEKLKTEKDIIVFGAGRAANDIIELLQRNNIKIHAITVSDPQIVDPVIFGVKVYKLQDLIPYKESALIIIGVTNKYYKEVEYKLKNMGFKNLLKVDE